MKYDDPDERFLKNMEMFLKYQFSGVYEQTNKKIKAIDAIFSLMNQGQMKDVSWN